MSERVAMGVYKRPSGRLLVAWRSGGGRLERHLLPLGATLTEAKNFRKQKLGEVAAGKLAAVIPGRCTFETVVALLKAEHELKRRTKQLNLTQLTAAFAGWKAKDIDAEAIERYVADRRAAGAADATIHNQLATLRHGLRLAFKRELIARVPDVPMPEVNNTVQCFFSVAELDRLLSLLPKALRPAVEFATLTGLRKGNVLGLTWDEVKFERREIVFAGIVMKNGEPLTAPFTARVEAILRAAYQRRKSSRVFDLPARLLRKAWAKAVGRKGLNKWGRKWDARRGEFVQVRPRFHDLRHTFAQHMSDAGIPDAEILKLGGWRTRAMLDRYRIASTAAQRAALARRDAHLKAERQAAKRQARVIDLLGRRTA